VTAPASLPDDELVRLARTGRRDAFAVLFHRHVHRIHGTVAAASPDAVAARTTAVGVFSDLMRHLADTDPARVGAALDQHAARRIRGRRGSGAAPPLTVGALDEMWRELDRRWPDGEPPRRDVSTIVPVTVGALVAVVVLGALASTSRRSGIPDPSRSFEAVGVNEEGSAFLAELPRPTETATAVGSPLPSPSPTAAPPPPEPTPEPTVEPTSEPDGPDPTETQFPDEPPEVEIRSPADRSTRVTDGEDEQGAYATVVLDGTASDDRDPPEFLAYAWSSSIGGGLADAATATVRLYVPDGQLTATHALTFTVTDTAGNAGTDTVTVVVTRV
jgi:hypothetical protein